MGTSYDRKLSIQIHFFVQASYKGTSVVIPADKIPMTAFFGHNRYNGMEIKSTKIGHNTRKVTNMIPIIMEIIPKTIADIRLIMGKALLT